MKRATTQKDISRNLGVSETTVSLVLNGRGDSISAQTRNAILVAAERAKLLSRRRAGTERHGQVAYVCLAPHLPTNWYSMRFLNGVQRELSRNGSLLVHHVIEEDKLPRKLLSRVDGLVVAETMPPAMLERISKQMPVVLLNTQTEANEFDSVMPDNKAGIRQIVEHLHGLGHERIGFHAVREFTVHHGERFRAFTAELERLGLPVDERWLFTPKRRESTVDEVYRLARETMKALRKTKERPTAIIFSADIDAHAFLRLAPEFGFSIPRDFSVAGYDNKSESEMTVPSLTTVEQPMEEMGKQAVKCLLQRLEDPDTAPKIIRVGVKLVARQSTAKPTE
jgi:LacI family transcriptional regulator